MLKRLLLLVATCLPACLAAQAVAFAARAEDCGKLTAVKLSHGTVTSAEQASTDGGREALMMAQRFPRYFDGIVAGAPANAMSRLLSGGAVRSAQLNTVEGHLSSAKLALLQASVLKSCGNGARYLKDPRQCRPDL